MSKFQVGDKVCLQRGLTQRTATSVWTVPRGVTIEIQQVDDRFDKVLVNDVWEDAGHIRRLVGGNGR